MAEYYTDSEKGNPLPPHRLLFPYSNNGYFICIITQTGYIYHGLCYTSRGALASCTETSAICAIHLGQQVSSYWVLDVRLREVGVVALHLPTGSLKKPALDWSRYRDANPVPTSLLADALRHCAIKAGCSIRPLRGIRFQVLE